MEPIITFSHSTVPLMRLFHKSNLLTLNDVFKIEVSKLKHNIETMSTYPTILQKNLSE